MARTRRSRPRGAEAVEVLSARAGADEALDALVGQFSDPFAFLRELVQNSLDAGSTYIDVAFEHQAKQQLAVISVADNGEGMNERIIDEHLLTMFSSTKEDDLTKIGKFGIGFVSIFAIEPELVVLETGQSGEAWRLLFHKDYSFEKLSLDDEVIEGTTVTLYKAARARELDAMRERGRETITYWCKYAEAEITVDGEAASRPFDVEAPLRCRHEEPGTELVVGLAPLRAIEEPDSNVRLEPSPTVGFYNRGLTLVERATLPSDEPDLAGLSFRIKSRYLEHTLTRDNVLVDESYHKAIAILRAQVNAKLRPALYAAIAEHARALCVPDVARASEDATSKTRAAQLSSLLLYTRFSPFDLTEHGVDVEAFPVLGAARALSLRELRQTSSPAGVLLYDSVRDDPLLAALREGGVTVLRWLPRLATLLHFDFRLQAAFATDTGLASTYAVELHDSDAALLTRTRGHLDAVGRRVNQLCIGGFDHRSTERGWLMLRQREAFGLCKYGEQASLFGGSRVVVLNARHPLVQRCRELARVELALAAQLLAQGVALDDGASADDCAAVMQRALEGASAAQAEQS